MLGRCGIYLDLLSFLDAGESLPFKIGKNRQIIDPITQSQHIDHAIDHD